MSRPLVFTVAIASSLIVLGALTGCSSGALPGSSSSGGPGSNSSATAAPAGTPSGGSAASFALPKTCLSAGDVSATLGEAAYGPTVSLDSTSLVCSYETATQDGPIISIMATKNTAANFLAQMTSGANSGNTQVHGVGDVAVVIPSAGGGKSIALLAGSFFIDIASLQASNAALVNLAKQVLAS